VYADYAEVLTVPYANNSSPSKVFYIKSILCGSSKNIRKNNLLWTSSLECLANFLCPSPSSAQSNTF